MDLVIDFVNYLVNNVLTPRSPFFINSLQFHSIKKLCRMPSSSSTPALDSGLRSDQFKEIPESEVKIKNKEEFSLATYQYYLQTCMIRMMKRQGSNLA